MAKAGRDRWGGAWSRSQTSFIFAVALAASLVAELSRGVDQVLSWNVMAAILAAAVIALLTFSYLRADRDGRPLPVAGAANGVMALDDVTTLAATADPPFLPSTWLRHVGLARVSAGVPSATIVDVTGGTAAMSIAAAAAAQRVGLRTTYTSTHIVGGQRIFSGLIEISAIAASAPVKEMSSQ